ncbi:hypothetical protein BJ508DRAFT_309636 [Ascobolus immersus RN42]|uniref:Uncharacterized protein n=1 Tax=Ascobolus immersus RN42 TaxID=1160509 RepID=A0A3N4HW03_ASCIM|nr:hypothetical protein BJ508DRAFT_309636 [Ascobolus immersus RN42]
MLPRDMDPEVKKLHHLIRCGTSFLAAAADPRHKQHDILSGQPPPLAESTETTIPSQTGLLLATNISTSEGDCLAFKYSSEGVSVWKMTERVPATDTKGKESEINGSYRIRVPKALDYSTIPENITLENWIQHFAVGNLTLDTLVRAQLLTKFIVEIRCAPRAGRNSETLCESLEWFNIFCLLSHIRDRFLVPMVPNEVASKGNSLKGRRFIDMFTNCGTVNTSRLQETFDDDRVTDLRLWAYRGVERNWKEDIEFLGGQEPSFDDDGHIILSKDTVLPFHNLISTLLSGIFQLIGKLWPLRYSTLSSQGNTELSSEASTKATEERAAAIAKYLKAVSACFELLRDIFLHWRSFQNYIQQPEIMSVYNTVTESYFAAGYESNTFFSQYKRISAWAASTVEYAQATSSLLDSLRGNTLSITVLEFPVGAISNTQSGLQELIGMVLDSCVAMGGNLYRTDAVVSDVKEWLARRGCSWNDQYSGKKHPRSLIESLISLDEQDVAAISEHLEGKEEQKEFASLANNLKGTKAFSHSVGPEPCCFFCNEYRFAIQRLCSGSDDRRGMMFLYHRLIIPWTPPPWECRVGVLDAVLQVVLERVRMVLYDNRLIKNSSRASPA